MFSGLLYTFRLILIAGSQYIQNLLLLLLWPCINLPPHDCMLRTTLHWRSVSRSFMPISCIVWHTYVYVLHAYVLTMYTHCMTHVRLCTTCLCTDNVHTLYDTRTSMYYMPMYWQCTHMRDIVPDDSLAVMSASNEQLPMDSKDAAILRRVPRCSMSVRYKVCGRPASVANTLPEPGGVASALPEPLWWRDLWCRGTKLQDLHLKLQTSAVTTLGYFTSYYTWQWNNSHQQERLCITLNFNNTNTPHVNLISVAHLQ
jgi:hypothetical protein